MTARTKQNKTDMFNPREISDSISPYQFFATTFKDFISWWYVVQPVAFIKQYIRLIDIIDDKFSTSFLIRTFFVPWHRDRQFVGYLVGIIARIIFIPIGLVLIALTTTGYLSLLIFWVIIPIVTIILIIVSPFR